MDPAMNWNAAQNDRASDHSEMEERRSGAAGREKPYTILKLSDKTQEVQSPWRSNHVAADVWREGERERLRPSHCAF